MKAPVHSANATHDQAAVAGTDLASREAVIEHGIGTFVEVGTALLAIREDRQYVEAGFPNFEAYCQRRWGMGRDYADRTIAAARVVAALPTNVSKPANESVARQLVSSPDPAAAWTQVVERHGPKPTAAQVREVVEAEVVGAPERDPAADWFKAGTQDHKDAKSELFRIDSAVKPCLKVDWELLSHQVVRMTKLERQSLAGSASVLESTARFLRQTLETKLEVVK